MKKILLLFLLIIPCLLKAQSPVIISQPYKFNKWVHVAGSLFSDSTLNNSDSSNRAATTAWAKRNLKSTSLIPTNGLQAIAPDSIGLGGNLTNTTLVNTSGQVLGIGNFTSGSSIFAMGGSDTTNSALQLTVYGGRGGYNFNLFSSRGIQLYRDTDSVSSAGHEQGIFMGYDPYGGGAFSNQLLGVDGLNHVGIEYNASIDSANFITHPKALPDVEWVLAHSGSTLGFTPENVANKETTLTNSSTLYPSGSAIVTALGGFLPLTGGTLTGNLTGTTLNISEIGGEIAGTPNPFSEAAIGLTTGGTAITRDVADGNSVLIVNQNNASSTGDVTDFKFNNSIVASIAPSGLIVNTDNIVTGRGNLGLTGIPSSFYTLGTGGLLIGRNYSFGNNETNFVNAPFTGFIGGFHFSQVDASGVVTDDLDIAGNNKNITTYGNLIIGTISSSITNNNDFVEIDQTTPGLLVRRTNAQVRSDLGLGSSGTPTIVGNTALGSGATATIVGNNQDGIISLVVGSSPSTGVICTITMGGSFAYGTKCSPVITRNDNTATTVPLTGNSIAVSGSSGTTTTWYITSGASLTAGDLLSFNYHNGGY